MMLVVVVVIETAPPEHSGEVGTSEDHLKNEKLQILANMAGSAGQFTHPSGIRGYRSYSG